MIFVLRILHTTYVPLRTMKLEKGLASRVSVSEVIKKHEPMYDVSVL